MTMNGMAGLGSVVGAFVECRRSILSFLAALRTAESMSAVGYPRFLRFILRFFSPSKYCKVISIQNLSQSECIEAYLLLNSQHFVNLY